MRTLHRSLAALALAASLAACGRDAVGPDGRAASPASTARLLLGTDESMRTVADSTDAAGNIIMVTEYAAGIYDLPDGHSGSVASVTVRTLIPGASSGGSSGTCITSTIERVETVAGWSYTVKKPGGCDREISVEFANRSTGKRAQFSFLMIPGKTRIDQGLVR